jgi:hypothetical protein
MRLRDPAITCFAALDSNNFNHLVLISFPTRAQGRTHKGSLSQPERDFAADSLQIAATVNK